MTTSEQSIDADVGSRVRDLRRAARISQTELGRRIGVTFQQVQKYENGANRIAASRLWAIAEGLGVHVSVLMSDIRGSGPRQNKAESDRRFVELWARVPDAHRVPLMALLESLATPHKPRHARRSAVKEIEAGS